MRKEEKEHLTDMLQEISYAYDRGDFWKAWSAMHKELSAMPVDSEEPCRPGTVTKEELVLFDRSRKFHCGNNAGEKKQFAIENDMVIIYGKKRCPEKTMSYDEFLASYFVIGNADTTNGWRIRICEALRRLNSSGLWPQVREVLGNILSSGMTWEDHCYLSSLIYSPDIGWTTIDKGICFIPADPQKVRKCRESYPFAFDGNAVKPEYISEITKCRFKTMFFAGWSEEVKREIKDRIKTREDYRTNDLLYTDFGITFEYDALKNEATYTEEHWRTMDMHWCIAIDSGTALFREPPITRILS